MNNKQYRDRQSTQKYNTVQSTSLRTCTIYTAVEHSYMGSTDDKNKKNKRRVYATYSIGTAYNTKTQNDILLN